jgi:hypothetical protein
MVRVVIRRLQMFGFEQKNYLRNRRHLRAIIFKGVKNHYVL